MPSEPLHFKIVMAPTPKGRARFTKAGHAYTPKKTADAEKEFRKQLRYQMGNLPMFKGQAIFIEARFVMPRPKTVKRADHIVKPDLDNLLKLAKDCGNGIVYTDDCLINRFTAMKVYASTVDPVGIHLRIGPTFQATLFD